MSTLKNILMSTNAAAQLRALVAKDALEALEPTLAALKMDIPAGYHHKDNLEHSIKVLENAIARETDGADLILRTAALFHDIGKPATRKFGARKAVTFDGHELVGARIVKKVLPKHGYSNAETKAVARLVALHMRSHGFSDMDWTDSAVRRLITDAGDEKALERLVIVFHADATTANMNKLRAHHAALDTLTREVARVKAVDARKAMRPAINGRELMDITGLSEGKELGMIMKFLNTDEGLALSREDAIKYALSTLNA